MNRNLLAFDFNVERLPKVAGRDQPGRQSQREREKGSEREQVVGDSPLGLALPAACDLYVRKGAYVTLRCIIYAPLGPRRAYVNSILSVCVRARESRV